jgi:hypothetical protein
MAGGLLRVGPKTPRRISLSGCSAPRRHRPRRYRPAKKRDELAPFHSIELHSVPSLARAGLEDIELARISQEVGALDSLLANQQDTKSGNNQQSNHKTENERNNRMSTRL